MCVHLYLRVVCVCVCACACVSVCAGYLANNVCVGFIHTYRVNVHVHVLLGFMSLLTSNTRVHICFIHRFFARAL